MKLITICVIVCAIALNLSLDCTSAQRPAKVFGASTPNTNDTAPPFSAKNFTDMLLLQQQLLSINITEIAFRDCNKTYSVPDYQRVDLFSPKRPDAEFPHISRTRKCLADCTMRRMGVITDDGLDVTTYMELVKKLRLNFTSFDINLELSETKDGISAVIDELVFKNLRPQDRCAALYGPERTAVKPGQRLTEVCSDLIESYSQAANECKNEKDLCGDSCETSWIILNCVVDSHLKRFFGAPFFPVPGLLSNLYPDEFTVPLNDGVSDFIIF